ncbi:Uncharacterised protein [Raoultella terrigena]|uniref:Uncharacterized protein n=1 Tax=Raoultella terrigena TaxID=577 RepID=A0A4U9CZU5_RAOTE|nr:Uncharacterised protein [Raoultella terrigena]
MTIFPHLRKRQKLENEAPLIAKMPRYFMREAGTGCRNNLTRAAAVKFLAKLFLNEIAPEKRSRMRQARLRFSPNI